MEMIGRCSRLFSAALALTFGALTLYIIYDLDVVALDRYLLLQTSTSEDYDLNQYRNLSISAYEAERHLLLADYDTEATSFAVGSPHNYLSPDLSTYITQLESFVDEYFDGSIHQSYFYHMLDNLKSNISPPLVSSPLPQTIFSFGKDGLDVPKSFELWQERLPNWKITIVDHERREEMFKRLTWGKGDGASKFRSAWNALSDDQSAVKVDILNHLKVLIDGGVYITSDMVPTLHPLQWGCKYLNGTAPSLQVLGDFHEKAFGPNRFHDATYYPEWRGGIAESDIAMVVAIENNDINSDKGLLNIRARMLQIADHVLMAKPYHPVLLDTISSTFRKIERNREKGRPLNIFRAANLSGPGPLTDSLLRYLLVRYGVTAYDVANIREATRFGDIIILPSWSFLQPEPDDQRWCHGRCA